MQSPALERHEVMFMRVSLDVELSRADLEGVHALLDESQGDMCYYHAFDLSE